jgi:hypothetical protein
MKISENRRLLLFIAATLIVPAGLSRVFLIKTHFDSNPVAQLRVKEPDIVMLSDSVLDNGVDKQLMSELLGGRRVELLWYGGSASASWYFRLKNHIVASGIHPELVCILFRDRMLTNPNFRTEGTYRYKLEATMHNNEPVFATLHEREAAKKYDLERLVDKLYPLNARRHVAQEKIERKLLRVLSNLGTTVTELQDRLNATFATSNLRGGGAEEAAALANQEEAEFDPDPRMSFLPHIVDVAQQANIRLCFLRVKRFPDADGRVAQSLGLRRYIVQLSRWIQTHGCYFLDDTDNLERTQDMYFFPGDDHMSPWAKRKSTVLYAEELRTILSR